MKHILSIEQELDVIELHKNKTPLKHILQKYDIKNTKTIYDIINRNGRPHLIANKRYNVNDNYFENIDNEEKSYWLGFLYADGNVRMKYNRSGELKLKLKKSDRNHIELFNKCLDSDYPIRDGIGKVIVEDREYISEYSVVTISNTKLVKDLMKLGCVSNKTFKITLPNLRKDLMRHFIRGYFDGDGYIHKLKSSTNGFVIGILGNDGFIESLQLYISNELNSQKIYVYEKGKIKKLQIMNNEDCIKIKKYFYNNSTIYLKRKKDIFDILFSNS